MSDELIVAIFTNLPTFAGLIWLGYELRNQLAEQRQMYRELMDDYNALVSKLIDKQAITQSEVQKLKTGPLNRHRD